MFSVLLSLTFLLATPAPTQIQFPDDPPNPVDDNVCPVPYDGARPIIDAHLTDPSQANLRDLAETKDLTPEDVRPLNSVFYEEDTLVCQQLNDKYSERFLNATDADFDAAYFKAGNRYFALFTLVPPEDMIVSGITEFMHVLDSDLNKIQGFAH